MTNDFAPFAEARTLYAQVLPAWMADYESTGNMWNDPYLMDWRFSPIERLVWGDIRGMCLPFYPQMPVLNYFIDFANPFLKIGIECDGKAWHDKEKDAARDVRLAAAGWMIFRIEGHECNRTIETYWDGDAEDAPPFDSATYFGATAEGVLKAIKRRYFDNEAAQSFLEGATLDSHRSTPETYPVPRQVAPRNDGPRLMSDDLAMRGNQ